MIIVRILFIYRHAFSTSESRVSGNRSLLYKFKIDRNCPDEYQIGMPGSTTVPAGKSAGLPQPPGAFSAPPASQKPPPPVSNNLPQPPGE